MIKNILKLFIIFLIILFVINIGYRIYREMILKDGISNLSSQDIENILENEIKDKKTVERVRSF